MNSVKIIGIVQAKNEWPLIALSVSHALMHHVDEVYVLNDCSNDLTAHGLVNLQKIWGDRIHVVNAVHEHFQQEAKANALISIAQRSSPDWFYFFDADEFLSIKNKQSLKNVLSTVDADVTGIEYALDNWISIADFDESRLDDYEKIIFKAVPDQGFEKISKEVVESIINGSKTFFDVPFPSKVIFRNYDGVSISAGSHYLRDHQAKNSNVEKDSQIHAMHVPMLSKTRLNRKLDMGLKHIAENRHMLHGWQNQLLVRVFNENRFDEYWNRHSIGSNSGQLALPPHVVDDGFSKMVEPVVCFLKEKNVLTLDKHHAETDSYHSSLMETHVPFSSMVHLASRLVKASDLSQSLTREQESIITSRSWKVALQLRHLSAFFRRAAGYFRVLVFK